jgi:hypothetical protein
MRISNLYEEHAIIVLRVRANCPPRLKLGTITENKSDGLAGTLNAFFCNLLYYYEIILNKSKKMPTKLKGSLLKQACWFLMKFLIFIINFLRQASA